MYRSNLEPVQTNSSSLLFTGAGHVSPYFHTIPGGHLSSASGVVAWEGRGKGDDRRLLWTVENKQHCPCSKPRSCDAHPVITQENRSIYFTRVMFSSSLSGKRRSREKTTPQSSCCSFAGIEENAWKKNAEIIICVTFIVLRFFQIN
jgi:hypothetical protein